MTIFTISKQTLSWYDEIGNVFCDSASIAKKSNKTLCLWQEAFSGKTILAENFFKTVSLRNYVIPAKAGIQSAVA
ncbi:MAG: hypothetical protein APR62_09095 [Smithella sp. SDB]|nr:MAG: hypothetical protein APR62_09095 [Smithella sp. SDB]